jgi:hypothetical protein
MKTSQPVVLCEMPFPIGIKRENTARLLVAMRQNGHRPEPLALAHMIAGGVTTSESGTTLTRTAWVLGLRIALDPSRQRCNSIISTSAWAMTLASASRADTSDSSMSRFPILP